VPQQGPPARGRTALEAVKSKATKTKRGPAKYRGPVNPRLRAFMGSAEYREMVQLLGRLNGDGQLDEFLNKAQSYWGSMNIFRLAELERSQGGSGVIATIRKDWPRIWPSGRDTERFSAFEQFSRFWGRLERSKLVDDVMKEVLPDMETGYQTPEKSRDFKKMKSMTEQERSEEVLKRIANAEIVRQYIGLSNTDSEVKSIGGKMMPFLAGCVSALERKVAAETTEMGEKLDTGLAVAAAVVVLLIGLFAAGVIPSPLEIVTNIWNFKV